jgi:hypothetical protein
VAEASAAASRWIVFVDTCIVLPMVIGYAVIGYSVSGRGAGAEVRRVALASVPDLSAILTLAPGPL